MTKTLVDCGNCAPDFQAIRSMAETNFGAQVLQTHGLEDTLEVLRKGGVDLVTINRKLDRDYSDGLEIAKAIKADPELQSTPVMLVTNYEEHQQTAIANGCERGFGKLAIGDAETHQRLAPYLSTE